MIRRAFLRQFGALGLAASTGPVHGEVASVRGVSRAAFPLPAPRSGESLPADHALEL